jgi:hypothetical protein
MGGYFMVIKFSFLPIIFSIVFCSSAFAADCNGGRYEDNGNGTVSDCRTGLIWLKNANCLDSAGGVSKTAQGQITLDNAQKWVAGLGNSICGLTDGSYAGDWRMPTKTEFMAMIQNAKKQGFSSPALTDAAGTAKWSDGNVFTNVQSHFYWTATRSTSDATKVWDFSLQDGNSDTNGSWQWVWPVRAGDAGTYQAVVIE